MKEFEQYRTNSLERIEKIKDPKELEQLKNEVLSRKGRLASFMTLLPGLPPEEKRSLGAALNSFKEEFTEKLNAKAESLNGVSAYKPSSVDITMEGFPFSSGRRHLINVTYDKILGIFRAIGFSIVEGPEVEDDHNNFEGLNFPPDHPARDTQDSFFLDNGLLLRTHTSPVQVRVLESSKPPIAVVSPGKCYRRDPLDASHSFMFNQTEGFLVDENIGVADLKGTIDIFIGEMFGKGIRSRFRPHFFPFTEPSMEVDMECIFCKGKGCGVCKQSGWIEIMGAGIIHPSVLESAGHDYKKYSGFAFGMGVERIAMLKYRVGDMRIFFENDLEFLRQFR